MTRAYSIAKTRLWVVADARVLGAEGPRDSEGFARVDILAEAGGALGFAIANLITLFAPPKVIIAGRAMASSEHFIRPLRGTVATLLPPSLADVAALVVREWDDSIWARGAAAMTLRELYGAPWGTTGPAPLRASIELRDEA